MITEFIANNSSLVVAGAAMAAIGLILGLLIGFAAKFFKVETNPNIELVTELLPNANCGGCGKAGCADFAKAVVNGELTPDKCPVSSQEIISAISKVLGLEIGASSRKVAVVLCGGDRNQTRNAALYNGINDCRSAALLGGGPKGCAYGCLGMSSCARSCPFGAIEMVNQLAIVHPELCVGCGVCVAQCPRKLIKLVDASEQIHVFCSSPEKAPVKKLSCKVPCIGCRKCQKAFPDNFNIEGFKATVNYEAKNKLTPDALDTIKCPGKCLLSNDEHLRVEHENPDNLEKNEVANS